ncbi:hypothetical protein T05_11968 [Trichinella murrelli]|uniref:Uncharacterized protein n=1 Tax=Trichinella murrelli TaxID=144512 RepID=A0A0V0T3D4_9BILA|nr:hypothetical protein T05_11968 [Trichinella murrelli]
MIHIKQPVNHEWSAHDIPNPLSHILSNSLSKIPVPIFHVHFH